MSFLYYKTKYCWHQKNTLVFSKRSCIVGHYTNFQIMKLIPSSSPQDHNLWKWGEMASRNAKVFSSDNESNTLRDAIRIVQILLDKTVTTIEHGDLSRTQLFLCCWILQLRLDFIWSLAVARWSDFFLLDMKTFWIILNEPTSLNIVTVSMWRYHLRPYYSKLLSVINELKFLIFVHSHFVWESAPATLYM